MTPDNHSSLKVSIVVGSLFLYRWERSRGRNQKKSKEMEGLRVRDSEEYIFLWSLSKAIKQEEF